MIILRYDAVNLVIFRTTADIIAQFPTSYPPRGCTSICHHLLLLSQPLKHGQPLVGSCYIDKVCSTRAQQR